MFTGCNITASSEAVIDVSEPYSWANRKYPSHAWALTKSPQIQLNHD